MNKVVTRVGAMLALSILSTSLVFAAPGDKDKAKAKAVKCPVCKMDLTMKKDKTHTKSVKIGKKTYYCCAGCDMSKKK